jgi:hypothetical protein
VFSCLCIPNTRLVAPDGRGQKPVPLISGADGKAHLIRYAGISSPAQPTPAGVFQGLAFLNGQRYSSPLNRAIPRLNFTSEVGTVSARIVHFGIDDRRRIEVLRSAGYSVDECGHSISLFHAALIGIRDVNAVVIAENDDMEPDEAISLVRATSMAPLILFQSKHFHFDESEFNLVVHPLTDPHRWLIDIRALIDQRNLRRKQNGSPTSNRPDE